MNNTTQNSSGNALQRVNTHLFIISQHKCDKAAHQGHSETLLCNEKNADANFSSGVNLRPCEDSLPASFAFLFQA